MNTLMSITIVGQGYVGLPIAVNAAKAGHRVFGFDIDSAKIKHLKAGITDSPDISTSQLLKLQSNGQLSFIDKLSKSEKSHIYVIAVPTPTTDDLNPDH